MYYVCWWTEIHFIDVHSLFKTTISCTLIWSLLTLTQKKRLDVDWERYCQTTDYVKYRHKFEPMEHQERKMKTQQNISVYRHMWTGLVFNILTLLQRLFVASDDTSISVSGLLKTSMGIGVWPLMIFKPTHGASIWQARTLQVLIYFATAPQILIYFNTNKRKIRFFIDFAETTTEPQRQGNSVKKTTYL